MNSPHRVEHDLPCIGAGCTGKDEGSARLSGAATGTLENNTIKDKCWLYNWSGVDEATDLACEQDDQVADNTSVADHHSSGTPCRVIALAGSESRCALQKDRIDDNEHAEEAKRSAYSGGSQVSISLFDNTRRNSTSRIVLREKIGFNITT